MTDSLAWVFRPIDVRRHNRAAILHLLVRYANPGAVVFDIGCGDKPFASDVRGLGCTYIGVDIADGFYKEKPDLIGTATDVPAADEVADVIISSQVLEHLENPVSALEEAHRLLKPGGVLLCSFPFLYPIHAPPYDYGRYTRFFISRAAERLGYEVLSEEAFAGYWRLCGMAFALYAQSFNRGPLKHTGIIPAVIAMQQWFCVGMHGLERLVVRLAGKDRSKFHQNWPVNYVFALGKLQEQVPKSGGA